MSDADKAAAQGRAAARMVATAEAPVHVTAKSAKLMAEARTLMPGGVSSPFLTGVRGLGSAKLAKFANFAKFWKILQIFANF